VRLRVEQLTVRRDDDDEDRPTDPRLQPAALDELVDGQLSFVMQGAHTTPRVGGDAGGRLWGRRSGSVVSGAAGARRARVIAVIRRTPRPDGTPLTGGEADGGRR